MDTTRHSSQNTGIGGKAHNRLTLGKRGVDPKTITSKLVNDRGRNAQLNRSQMSNDFLGPGTMMSAFDTSGRVSSSIEDIENIKRLNPELDLAQQVQIALILSPKDFINTDINYSLPPGILPSVIADGMIEVAKTYYETSYNIKAKLPDILKKALFEEGADIWAVIPENSLDDLIHGKHDAKQGQVHLESILADPTMRTSFLQEISRPLGLLGGRTDEAKGKMSLESMLAGAKAKQATTVDGYGEMTYSDWGKKPDGLVLPIIYDNPGIMKLPLVMKTLNEDRHRVAMESIGFGGNTSAGAEALAKYFSETPMDSKPVVAIRSMDNASREAIGHPLIQTLPTESVIPIFVPGEPETHVAYYVVLDENGSPVTRHGSLGYYRNMYSTVDGGAQSKIGGLLRQAAEDESDFDQYRQLQRMQEATVAFQEATIRELEARAKSGTLQNISLARQTQTYQIMLARALSSMQTRILYIPAEMVVFWAYDFNMDGTGRSVLENIKQISGMRALTLMSNLEAQVRNSVDHNSLDITIDERDPSPQKTRDAIIHAYAQKAGNTIPWASGNPRHMAEYLAMRGTNINVEGGSNYPGTRVEITSRDIPLKDVDMSFDESLAKREMMGIGMPPELVDLTTQIEFSSKMATSNDLATKRATVLSDKTSSLLKRDLVVQITNSKILKDRLLAVIGKHADELTPAQKELGEAALLFIFLAYFEVKLPTPSNGLRQKKEDFDEYLESLDLLLDALFSDEVFTDTEEGNLGDQNGETAKQIRVHYRNQHIIQWCRTNNFMVDVIDNILDIDEQDAHGTIFAQEALDTALRMGHLVKALGVKLLASKQITQNQWTLIRQGINKFNFEGDGSGEAEAGTGGGDSYSDSGDGGGSGSDDDFMSDLNLDDEENQDNDNQDNQEEEEQEEEEKPNTDDDSAGDGKGTSTDTPPSDLA